MVEKIQHLSKSQILFIINEFIRDQSGPLKEELETIRVKQSNINYENIKKELSLLWTSFPVYKIKIEAWINTSARHSDNKQVFAMGPISGVVSITALIIFHKLSNKIIEAQYPSYSNLLLPVEKQVLKTPSSSVSEQIKQIYCASINFDLQQFLKNKKNKSEIDIFILTIVKVEYDSVIPFLKNKKEVKGHTGSSYTVGDYKGFKIAVRRNFEQGNVSMALEAERGLQFLNPKIVLLVGLAGGLKKVAEGDVVIAASSYYYESGKETVDGFKFRPKGGTFNFELKEQARYLADNVDWLLSESQSMKHFEIITGLIVAGEKVVISDQTRLIEDIKKYCEDAVALSMEGFGLFSALEAYPAIKGLEIRGISDMISKGDKDLVYNDGGRELAAKNASEFAFNLIDYLSREL